VYDREYNGQRLEFETSGGLLNASLVMRDRQTDSWWSIMTGDAIGGHMQGEALKEIPVGEKTTFGAWKEQHPNTLVLSVGGREHDDQDAYAGYWESDRTFRGMEITDHRMKPKQSIYSFQHESVPYAVAHDDFESGALFALKGDEARRVVLYRAAGASLHASSRALLVPEELVAKQDGRIWFRSAVSEEWDTAHAVQGWDDVEALAGVAGVETLSGFDTFWYNWVSVHPNSVILD
jgi:hypothetical protein